MFVKMRSLTGVFERLTSPLSRAREELPLSVRVVRTKRRNERLRAWWMTAFFAVSPAMMMATFALTYQQIADGRRSTFPSLSVVDLISTYFLLALIGLSVSWVVLLCKRSLKSFLTASVVGVGGLLIAIQFLFTTGGRDSYFLQDTLSLGLVTGLLSGLFAFGLVKWRKLDWWS